MLSTVAEVISSSKLLMSLWKHECSRVFADRFTTREEKDWFEQAIKQASDYCHILPFYLHDSYRCQFTHAVDWTIERTSGPEKNLLQYSRRFSSGSHLWAQSRSTLSGYGKRGMIKQEPKLVVVNGPSSS